MDFITWDDTLSVGVTQFDNEHKQLVNFINKLNHALEIKGTQKTMEEILTSLVRYTAIHFKHEEDYMITYDYPDYQRHKKEHDELTAQVSDFYERFKSGKVAFSLELMVFLRDWLTGHIKGSDMSYREFFIQKGV